MTIYACTDADIDEGPPEKPRKRRHVTITYVDPGAEEIEAARAIGRNFVLYSDPPTAAEAERLIVRRRGWLRRLLGVW